MDNQPPLEDFTRIDALVGARVRLLRERRRMSQTVLGERVGVSFQQIQKYERGTNRISASTLFQIARTLGVGPADFFEGLHRPGQSIQDWSKLADPQADDLVHNFRRISSAQVRSRIVEMVAALAVGDD